MRCVIESELVLFSVVQVGYGSLAFTFHAATSEQCYALGRQQRTCAADPRGEDRGHVL